MHPHLLQFNLFHSYSNALHLTRCPKLMTSAINAHTTPLLGISPVTLGHFPNYTNVYTTSGTLLGFFFSILLVSSISSSHRIFVLLSSLWFPMDSLVPRGLGYSLAILAGLGMIWRLCSDPRRPLTVDLEVTALPQPRFHLRITLGPAVSICQNTQANNHVSTTKKLIVLLCSWIPS